MDTKTRKDESFLETTLSLCNKLDGLADTLYAIESKLWRKESDELVAKDKEKQPFTLERRLLYCHTTLSDIQCAVNRINERIGEEN